VSRPTEIDQALESNEPGSRRFRDLITRERHDMGWLVHVVACMYDEISGGMISKPMTYPHEVIGAFDERVQREADRAVDDERERVTIEIKALDIEGLLRIGHTHTDVETIRATILTIVNNQEVTT
jgi:hypothetical protein